MRRAGIGDELVTAHDSVIMDCAQESSLSTARRLASRRLPQGGSAEWMREAGLGCETRDWEPRTLERGAFRRSGAHDDCDVIKVVR